MGDFRNEPEFAHGVPTVAVSSTSTRVNKTGSWKYIRPVYQDKVAPCHMGCPVGIDIESCMNLLREQKLDEACDLWLRENPLPAVTGRVCYHRCENACNRERFDDAVSIHAVERMLGDRLMERPDPPASITRPETVGIVGAGPAGLACAYHLARLGYSVTIYEAEPEPGGVLRWGIPEYRLPKAVLAREVKRIENLGVRIRCNVRIGRDLTYAALERHEAVFVAAGVQKSRALGVPGEALAGVRPGLEFLRAVNRGEKPEIGRHVVVVGGGNTAMDCARTALRLGAEVTVVYRRGREQMPANREEIEEALAEGVKLELLAGPVEVRADQRVPDEEPLAAIEATFGDFAGLAPDVHVSGLVCQRMRLGAPDESGRRRPEPVPESRFTIPADTILTALGEEAETGFLPDGVSDHGVIRVNPLGGTSRTAVFAGGDLIEEPHTVAFAIGSGKRAAIGIDHWLRYTAGEDPDSVEVGELRLGPSGNLSMTRWRGDDPVTRHNEVNEVVRFAGIHTAHFRPAPRHPDRMLDPDERRGDFSEVNRGLAAPDAMDEAGRCFNCGVCNGCEVCLIFCPDLAITRRDDGGFDIDYDHCKGCGICVAECPRGAMAMTREGL